MQLQVNFTVMASTILNQKIYNSPVQNWLIILATGARSTQLLALKMAMEKMTGMAGN